MRRWRSRQDVDARREAERAQHDECMAEARAALARGREVAARLVRVERDLNSVQRGIHGQPLPVACLVPFRLRAG